MTNLKIVFALVIITAVLTACGGGGGSDKKDNPAKTTASLEGLAECTPADPMQGVICGTALAADGITPLAGAEIKLLTEDKSAGIIETKGIANAGQCLADSQGDFACVTPENLSGPQQFVIEVAGFETKSFSANVEAGIATDVGQQTMVADNSTQWLVIPGFFDGVQVLLSQLKDCELTHADGGVFDPDFDDPAQARGSNDCASKGLVVLDEYDFLDPDLPNTAPVVLASGQLDNFDALFINCDANFSDSFGFSGLNQPIQNFVAQGKPVYFSDLSDSWLSELFPGRINFAGNETIPGEVSGNVVHSGLAGVVGSPINLVFDFDVWTAIGTVDSAVTTFIEGDISDLSDVYAGIHPITVGWKETSSSGCVFYTSYHIEGASSGAPQELAIKYLVQNFDQVCS